MFRAALLSLALLSPLPAAADSLRVATWNVELARRGPGLLLRDILGGDPQVEAVAQVVAKVAPDILLLTGVDWDFHGAALAALAQRFAEAGIDYPHRYAPRPNTGLATGLDMDGDGYLGDGSDAQGFGRFAGDGGMALLSRFPIGADPRDFSDLLWRDLPGATLPHQDGAPFPSEEAQAVQRLSSSGHWDVPVILPSGREIRTWAFHATPPVFDGPEDRNGLRNRDEAAFWLRYLDGALGDRPEAPFVLMGDANLDPLDGDGLPDAMEALLSHPRLQDPRPASEGGAVAAEAQGGVNAGHRGDPALDTADWDDDGPGNLRVDYILPSSEWQVLDAGVFWPAPGARDADLLSSEGTAASRHRLVWADLALPD
ncbi:endonuclease/exonuclease/phosphatase family protein [Roseitranquillus sediminis]|uniref:endonuclease/exonuclease/phosphatase family protein n=1 Tax=Roseitranquillus sediminis TaxID=2809051 RepID=UPI001D0C365F|nr:endonuclease/exonuclease/phosphatase family protein [Roseitranquillus sediminis]MBM9596212.1 endonuclease/exonuclease/phosphatase family protein [Roseitranquillus sediminis]